MEFIEKETRRLKKTQNLRWEINNFIIDFIY